MEYDDVYFPFIGYSPIFELISRRQIMTTNATIFFSVASSLPQFFATIIYLQNNTKKKKK